MNRIILAMCLACRHTWTLKLKVPKDTKVDWLQCPKCGELQGADLDYTLDNNEKANERRGGLDA